MHQRHFLFAAFFALFLCIWGIGCSYRYENLKAHRETQDAYVKLITDENALMPKWFRVRYTPWQDPPDFEVSDENLGIFAGTHGAPFSVWIHPLLLTFCLLGLVLYPLWIFLGCLWYRRVTGDNSLFAENGDAPPVIVVVAAGALGCYVANIILSWVFYGLIYLGLSLFYQEDYYVPWAFISYSLHAVVHLTALAVLALFAFRAIFRSFGAANLTGNASQPPNTNPAAPGTQPNPSGASSPSPTPVGGRIRSAVLAVVKSLIVAILTGVGSELGGWIGGTLVFVAASGMAAYFGFRMPSSNHR